MKNTVISIILFALVMSFVAYCDYSLNNLTNYIEKQTIKIEDLLESENYIKAYDISNNLTKELNQKKVLLSIYVNHCDFDNIINESIRLTNYIKNKDISESNVSVHILYNLSDNINTLHKPNIENIL